MNQSLPLVDFNRDEKFDIARESLEAQIGSKPQRAHTYMYVWLLVLMWCVSSTCRGGWPLKNRDRKEINKRKEKADREVEKCGL